VRNTCVDIVLIDSDSPVVARARAQDIRWRAREEQTLYEIAQALSASPNDGGDPGKGQPAWCPFVTCALFLGDDEQGYVCRYAHGRHGGALQVGAEVVSEASLRLPLCADGRAGHGEDLTSVLSCPLRFDGRLIGGS